MCVRDGEFQQRIYDVCKDSTPPSSLVYTVYAVPALIIKAVPGTDFRRQKSRCSPAETLLTELLLCSKIRIGFVSRDDLERSPFVVERMQNFVQTRISLLVVEKRHQLTRVDVVCATRRDLLEQFFDIVARTYALVQLLEFVQREFRWIDRVILEIPTKQKSLMFLENKYGGYQRKGTLSTRISEKKR